MRAQGKLPLAFRACAYANICGNIVMSEHIDRERLKQHGATETNMFGESLQIETARCMLVFSEYSNMVGLKGERGTPAGPEGIGGCGCPSSSHLALQV